MHTILPQTPLWGHLNPVPWHHHQLFTITMTTNSPSPSALDNVVVDGDEYYEKN